MKYRKINIKNELLYLFILVSILEVFNYSVLRTSFSFLLILALLGLLVLEIWFIKIFVSYSGKKVSKYSNVLVKISLRERFFAYFILPALFYLSLLVFLYFNRNYLLGHTVLGICSVLLLILFLNVKRSLSKVYSVASTTRAIFDFLCITIFYLLLNSFVRTGASLEIFTILSSLSALILLLFVLKIHDKIGFLEVLISIFSALFISFFTIFFWNHNIFIIPTIGVLAYYLIISLWNIRFAGRTGFLDYIFPILYVVVAIILVLTL